MIHKAVFSSDKDNWETPYWLYDILDSEFHFELDPCADDGNAKCDEYYTIEEDGLSQPWAPKITYVNPPYGRKAWSWIKKSLEESQQGTTVVMLLPNRSSNLWWHKYVMKSSEIRFINGRLNFTGGKYFAPFPSVVVIFRPGDNWPVIGASIDARSRKGVTLFR